MQYMPAQRMIHTKEVRDDESIVEIVVWLLNSPVPPCQHRYKYRLFFGIPGECFIRYDNELGKGDHRHYGELEGPYHFVSIPQLLADFKNDVETWEDP
jgi:hypothetical protein